MFGLGPEWSGPRWLAFVEGRANHPVWAAWLGHGGESEKRPDAAWAFVGTYSRERSEYSGLGRETSFVDVLAGAAAMVLLDDGVTSLDEVDAVATSWQTWERTNVIIDGQTLAGRRLAHRGAWACVTERPDAGLVVHWNGMGDDVPALSNVSSSTQYAVDFTERIAYPAALLRSRSVALGDD